jgi:hypothetical protein
VPALAEAVRRRLEGLAPHNGDTCTSLQSPPRATLTPRARVRCRPCCSAKTNAVSPARHLRYLALSSERVGLPWTYSIWIVCSYATTSDLLVHSHKLRLLISARRSRRSTPATDSGPSHSSASTPTSSGGRRSTNSLPLPTPRACSARMGRGSAFTVISRRSLRKPPGGRASR